MTDFKAIFGKKIKFLTTDLTMSSVTEAELFYRKRDSEFKVGVNLAAFASGGNMGTARCGISGNVGTQTAGLAVGGDGGSTTNITEEYVSYITSGSFGKLYATTVSGDASKLSNRTPPNVTSGSGISPIAGQISASFQCGFEFTGNIGKLVGVWSAGGALILAS